ncbi:hypothetical protein PR048_008516 [Dryococelus australis]|uniref:Uncharacterized protein n=1 Tax=Dryococelus australis TaxID=614101 RepID=A0ABQ9HXB6_9NEOP|nr:hypothetical protein PR048_008516 [Dryococelus australis]
MQSAQDLSTFPDTTGISQELGTFWTWRKISQFITVGDVWNGDVRDTSLFEFWKHMKSLVTTQPGTGVNSATPPSFSASSTDDTTSDDLLSATDAIPLASVDFLHHPLTYLSLTE